MVTCGETQYSILTVVVHTASDLTVVVRDLLDSPISDNSIIPFPCPHHPQLPKSYQHLSVVNSPPITVKITR